MIDSPRKMQCSIYGIAMAVLLAMSAHTGWAQEKKADLGLGPSDYAFLLQMARTSAATLLKDKDLVPEQAISSAEEQEVPNQQTVYVSLFADGFLNASARGDRMTVTEAVKVAGTRLGGRLRTVEHGQAKLDRGRIKIDVVKEGDLLQRAVITRYMDVLDPGVEGIAIRMPRGWAHLLPTTLLFVGPQAEIEIGKILELADRGTVRKRPDVRKLNTKAFIELEPGKGAVELFRGNVILDKASADDMEKAALQAGLWLLSIQLKNGHFKYRFNPVLSTQDPTYNIVRHAGTCWSLLWLYRSTGDKHFLDALKSGLAFLAKHTERAVEPCKFAHIRFAKKSPLGAGALTLLIKAEATLSGALPADKETMEELANFIALMQQDSGQFCKYLREAIGHTPPKKEPQYYPGQCMLALLQYNKLSPNKKWLDIVKKSAELQIQRFMKDDFADQWVMLALEELYRVTKDERYAAACHSMADSILKKQHKPGDVPDPDYVGGFNRTNPPETCSAATRMEGLVAAWNLADKTGAPSDHYLQALKLAAKFIMQQQFRPDNSYMANPKLPFLGGFHASPTDFELRMDYAQHAICALIGTSQIIRSLEKK
ncbi:MAG: hypothetical protein GXP25_10100 [Planctomycetes bacterium]|nr:hypothetical protein [Planctomycetota bacterium]